MLQVWHGAGIYVKLRSFAQEQFRDILLGAALILSLLKHAINHKAVCSFRNSHSMARVISYNRP